MTEIVTEYHTTIWRRSPFCDESPFLRPKIAISAPARCNISQETIIVPHLIDGTGCLQLVPFVSADSTMAAFHFVHERALADNLWILQSKRETTVR